MTGQSVPDCPCAGDDRVADQLAAILRAALAAGRTDEWLEEHSGVNHHTIKSYRTQTRRPSLANGLSIAAVLGAKQVNQLLNLIGYQARPLDEADELQPMQITANAMGHLSVIARAAADNRIDHVEEPETTEAADALIATVLPLSTAGKGRR